MLNVNVVCVGKLKEAYWRDACAEYAKRLSAYCKYSVIELPESRISQKPSDAEISIALAAEAKLMRPYLHAKGVFSVALCVEAPQISSEEFAARIETEAAMGASAVNFFVGSSFGLDKQIKQDCRLRLGLSKMTLPHQLARVVLAEQIYRAFSINSGSKYHK